MDRSWRHGDAKLKEDALQTGRKQYISNLNRLHSEELSRYHGDHRTKSDRQARKHADETAALRHRHNDELTRLQAKHSQERHTLRNQQSNKGAELKANHEHDIRSLTKKHEATIKAVEKQMKEAPEAVQQTEQAAMDHLIEKVRGESASQIAELKAENQRLKDQRKLTPYGLLPLSKREGHEPPPQFRRTLAKPQAEQTNIASQTPSQAKPQIKTNTLGLKRISGAATTFQGSIGAGQVNGTARKRTASEAGMDMESWRSLPAKTRLPPILLR